MTIVKFDSVYFDNYILPNIKKAKDDLKKARNKAKLLQVSSDYKYNKYLNDLDEKIKKHLDDLNKFDNWVDKCKKSYKSLSDKYQDKIEKIDGFSIEKHKKI